MNLKPQKKNYDETEFPVEACSGASETRGNEWAQDTRRHSFNGLTSKQENFNAFPTYAASS